MDKPKEEAPRRRPRAKKAKGHGHHGGAWKVAYADFVTAMMALFLVLWLVSQADTKLKQAIANYFRSPGVFDSMEGGILSQAKKVSQEPSNLTSKDDEQALFGVAQALERQFSTRPEFSQYKDQVKVELTEEGLRIQLIDKADKLSFANGSAELASEAQAVLTEIAKSICSLPNKINIGGHTDSRVFPSENGYTNWELSTDRANAARRVLVMNCVKEEQIRRIVGFADTEPMVPQDLYSPANRRISITLLRIGAPSDANAKPAQENAPETAPSEAPKEPVTSNEPKPSDKEETKKANEKLKSGESVVVGEPDVIPNKPKAQ